MPPIIRETGGIVALSEARAGGVVLYNRASSYSPGQYGRGGEKLETRTHQAYKAVRPLRRVVAMRRGVEKGYMSVARPILEEAAEYARKRRLILVAPDLSRFIRAESHYKEWPTADEFARLRERTGGVTLATIAPPTLTERERHRSATRRGKPGRPSKDDKAQFLRILELRGDPDTRSYDRIAELTGIPRTTVRRRLSRPVPWRTDGLRWCDFDAPLTIWVAAKAKAKAWV